jgi:hypothetical protein
MAKLPQKVDFPVAHIRRYLEPGPVVMVTSAHGGRRNIMTMAWQEFHPAPADRLFT